MVSTGAREPPRSGAANPRGPARLHLGALHRGEERGARAYVLWAVGGLVRSMVLLRIAVRVRAQRLADGKVVGHHVGMPPPQVMARFA